MSESSTIVPPAKALAPGGNSSALDQWRGFALLLVLISHSFIRTHRVDGVGRVGVNLFFFISGILVFRSLTGHRAEHGHRALNFWKRRFIRLFPALLCYLAAVIPLIALLQPHGLEGYLRKLPIAIAFLADYFEVPVATGHLWSVAVEMQFYLLAPLLFALGGVSRRRRTLVWGGALLLFVALGCVPPLLSYARKYEFQFTVWPMLLGFFCEAQRERISQIPRRWMDWTIRGGTVVIVLLLVLILLGLRIKAAVIGFGTLVFIPCFFSYLTAVSLAGRPGAILRWLGERTYSIYLWQQPLTLCQFLPIPLWPLGALLAIPVGAVSYFFSERPFLSRKRKH